jgi:hypothetical protein
MAVTEAMADPVEEITLLQTVVPEAEVVVVPEETEDQVFLCTQRKQAHAPLTNQVAQAELAVMEGQDPLVDLILTPPVQMDQTVQLEPLVFCMNLILKHK